MSEKGGLDSRLIPLLLAAGWLLVTLGVWGACGRWWVWPLSVGAALLLTGAGYSWAFWQELKAKARGADADRFERRSA